MAMKIFIGGPFNLRIYNTFGKNGDFRKYSVPIVEPEMPFIGMDAGMPKDSGRHVFTYTAIGDMPDGIVTLFGPTGTSYDLMPLIRLAQAAIDHEITDMAKAVADYHRSIKQLEEGSYETDHVHQTIRGSSKGLILGE